MNKLPISSLLFILVFALSCSDNSNIFGNRSAKGNNDNFGLKPDGIVTSIDQEFFTDPVLDFIGNNFSLKKRDSCLQRETLNNEGKMLLSECLNDKRSEWTFHDSGTNSPGNYTIRWRGTENDPDLCIRVDNPGDPIRFAICNNGINKFNWKVSYSANGKYRFESVAFAGQCLANEYATETDLAGPRLIGCDPLFDQWDIDPEPKSVDLSHTNEKADAFRDWYNNRATEKEKLAADNYSSKDPIFYRVSRNYHHLGNRDSQLRCDPHGHHKPFHVYDDFCILSYPDGDNFIDHPSDPTDRGIPAVGDGNSPSLLIHIDDLNLTNISDTTVTYHRDINCSIDDIPDEDKTYCSNNKPLEYCTQADGYGNCLSSEFRTGKEESYPAKTANNLVNYRNGVYHTNHKYLLNPCHLRLGDFIENGTDPKIECDMSLDFEKFASKQVASNKPDSTEKWILGVAKAGEFIGALTAFAVAPYTTIGIMASYSVGKGIVKHESPVQVIEELALLVGGLYPPIMFLEMTVGLIFSVENALNCKSDALEFSGSCAGAYEDLALNLGMMAFMGGQMYKNAEPITKQHLKDVLNETGETKPLLSEDSKSSVEKIVDEKVKNEVEECLTGGIALTGCGSSKDNWESLGKSDLTQRLSNVHNLNPVDSKIINGKKFWLSKIVPKSTTSKSKSLAILYSEIADDNGTQIVSRLVWKSDSDGGWRATPGIENRGTISKGKGRIGMNGEPTSIHYSQETKLDKEILELIDTVEKNQEPNTTVSYQDLIQNFRFDNALYAPDYTYKSEVSEFIGVRDLLRPLLHRTSLAFRADYEWYDGLSISASATEHIENINRQIENNANFRRFVPDFEQTPSRTYKAEHSSLNTKVNIEVYESSHGYEDFEWHMATDSDGRVWIDRIQLKGAGLSSYGNSKVVIDTGLLTSKPLDYPNHLTGLSLGEYERTNIEASSSQNYFDITPLLKKLWPIAEYINFKGIN